MNQEEDELPGGATADAVAAAVDSFQVQASGQEASSGTVLVGVGLGLATGFLARAGSLAVRPASLMCVAVPYLLRLFFGDTRHTLAAGREPSLRCV